MKKVLVIGAGSWGSALAIVLADNGYDVRIWGRRKEQIDEINERHTNEKYLPNIVLPTNIVAYSDFKEAVKDIDTVLIVVPSSAIRETVKRLKEAVDRPLTIIHASKGIEPKTHKRISEIIEEELEGTSLLKEIVVLSGPSHAEEVSLRQPTTVTVSSKNKEAAEKVQDMFMNKNFRVYTNLDLIGVEIGGALKNIIAIACGLTHGLGYGDNSKAAIMTRGLAEITRLGTKLGANRHTFAGLSGLGDLIVTCTSTHSRNYRAGILIGQGKSVDEVLQSMGMVVEGVRTTMATYELARKLEVDMPITFALYDVLFSGLSPKAAAEELMGRVKKHEMESLSAEN